MSQVPDYVLSPEFTSAVRTALRVHGVQSGDAELSLNGAVLFKGKILKVKSTYGSAPAASCEHLWMEVTALGDVGRKFLCQRCGRKIQ